MITQVYHRMHLMDYLISYVKTRTGISFASFYSLRFFLFLKNFTFTIESTHIVLSFAIFADTVVQCTQAHLTISCSLQICR